MRKQTHKSPQPIYHKPVSKVTMLPSGAVISEKRLDAYRADGWTNILTGLGLGNDKRIAGKLEYNRLVEIDVETLYAGDDICARVVDLLPDTAMRKWVDFQGLEDDVEIAFQKKLAEIEAKKKALQALKWGRLYGGAGLLKGTDEMEDLTVPLVPEEVDNVYSLTLMTRYELYPSQLQYDPLKKNFGYPEFYRLQLRGASPVNGKEVHHSRIVRFEGVELPRRLHIQNQYWADSVLSRLYDVIRSFNTTHNSIATVMQDFRVGIFKLKNLADMIAMGEDGLVQKRIALVDAAKSVARSVVIDAEGESFEQATGQLSGVKDMIEAVDQRLVAATGIPITVLFGRSPQGLGGSGRHEETNWYDMVAAYQEDVCRPVLKDIFETVLLSKDGPTGGEIPDGFGFTFNPLWQLDEKEQTEMRYVQAQADEKYIVNGVVTPEEVAISRFGNDKWDAHTKIDLSLRKEISQQGTQNMAGTPGAAADPNAVKPTVNQKPANVQPDKGVPGMELNSAGQVAAKSGPAATRAAQMPNDDAADPDDDEILENANNDDGKHVATIGVTRGKQMLMGKRKDSGRWTHPGGHLNKGEKPLDAAVRELKEESGIEADAADMKHLGSQKVTTFTGKKMTVHAFHLPMKDSAPTTTKLDPDQEIAEWQWVDCTDGLPNDVSENLHSPKNYLLQKMGYQPESKYDAHDMTQMYSAFDRDNSLVVEHKLDPIDPHKTISPSEPITVPEPENVDSKEKHLGTDDNPNESRPAQTVIVSKSVAKTASAARKIAQEFTRGQELQSSDETSQSFRFRMRSPGDFLPGTMKTFKPEGKPGVSIVFGTLKGK